MALPATRHPPTSWGSQRAPRIVAEPSTEPTADARADRVWGRRDLPRADEPHRRVPRRSPWGKGARVPFGPIATTASVVLHVVVFAVVVILVAVPAAQDPAGPAMYVHLTPELVDQALEDEAFDDLPPLEELEELPEPDLLAEPPPELEELEPLPELASADVLTPARIPELSLAVVEVRRPPAPTPVPVPPAVQPPPRPIRVHTPFRPPLATRRPVAAPRRAPRRASRVRSRLVKLYTPHNYPSAARSRGVQGVVRVEMLVGADGSVSQARVVASSGHPELDQAALGSARQWRFQPPGAPRRAVQSFRFRLR